MVRRQFPRPASASAFVTAALTLGLVATLVAGTRVVAHDVAAQPVAAQLNPADVAQVSSLLYGAQSTPTGAWMRNHANDISGSIGVSGMRVAIDSGDVTTTLVGVGRRSQMTAVSAAQPTIKGNRVTLRHLAAGVGVTEWWSNDPTGIEHGFTLAKRPAGLGPMILRVEIGGSLRPALGAADRLAFGDGELTYSGLVVTDATDRAIAAHLALDGARLSIVVDDMNAVYPLTIDPTWSQEAYLKASNTGFGDQFGVSVAVSGDTIVVGAPYEDSNATGVDGNQADDSADQAGAAYVFTRSGTTWSQQAYLKASNSGAVDRFGYSVAVSGDTIVVGAYGEDSNATGVDGTQVDNSASFSGAAYVFTRSGTTWSQQAYLKASDTGANDRFGYAVAVSGETIAVGAYDDSSISGGAAYVFTRSGTTWSQQANLQASNAGAGDQFGYAIAVSGDTIVVGAPYEDSNATGVDGSGIDNLDAAGAAYVFKRSGTTWSQQAYLKASNTAFRDKFGYAVAASGDTVVVGAPYEDSNATGVDGNGADNSATDSGAAYVFTRSVSTWSQQAYLKASNTDAGDWFGYAAAVSGDTIVVGAYGEGSSATGVGGNEADNGASFSGAAYRFTRNNTTWSQQAYLKATNTGALDLFGLSVAVSGDTIVVGASFEASSATGVGGIEADNGAGQAGAAYVFAPSTPCTPGHYSATGSTPCSAADAGYYVSGSGETSQTACSAGAYQPNTAQPSCLPADAGHYVETTGATTQTECGLGYFAATTGHIACDPADAGYYVDTYGAISQTPCSAGYFTVSGGHVACDPADAGHYVESTGATTQTECGPGYFAATTAHIACDPAEPGHYVESTGATSQTECAPGYFAATTAHIACDPAEAGHYVDATGATNQTECSPGFYQPYGAQPNCLAADGGNYVAGTGATSASSCSTGTYQPNTGQSSCLNADAGHYVDTTGSLTQTDCAAGTYQPNTGQVSCLDADAGHAVPHAGAATQVACNSLGRYQPSTGQTTLPGRR